MFERESSFPARQRPHVLLAEADPAARVAVKNRLEEAGFKVCCLDDGPALLRAIQTGHQHFEMKNFHSWVRMEKIFLKKIVSCLRCTEVLCRKPV
jgi:CheY-like chemotaxis protein